MLKTIWNAAVSWFRPRGSNLRSPERWLVDWVRDQPGLAGVSIHAGNAETIACFFQAITLITGDLAKLPIHVYSDGTNGRERAKSHPLYRLLRRKPSQELTAFVWKRKLARDVLIHGNAYALIVRDALLRPIELIPMDPQSIRPARDKESRQLFYQWRESSTSEWKSLRREDVLHWRNVSDDGIVGKAIVDLARGSLGLTKAAEDFGARFFGNGSIGSGVLSYPNRLDDETVARVRRQWEAMHSNENQHRVAVLQAGVDFKPLTIPPEQAQFLMTRQFQRQELASWFNLPPHKLGDDSRTSHSSLEQENQAYLDSSLDPLMVNLEEELWDKCLLEREKVAGFEVEFLRAALLRPDMKTRFEVYGIGTLNGILKVNECRAAENLPPVKGGDEIRVPLNTTSPNPPAPASPKNQKVKTQRARRTRRRVVGHDPSQSFVALIRDCVAAKIRWEIAAIERLAKKPETFADELDAFYLEHRGRMLAALAPPLACAAAVLQRDLPAADAVDQYLKESQRQLAASRGPITDVLSTWEPRAHRLAVALLFANKKCPNREVSRGLARPDN